PISGPERVASIVNAGGFRRRTVEFHNLEVAAGAQIFGVAITDIVAADEEPIQLSRDFVNPLFQIFGPKERTIAKDTALSVVTCLDQTNRFSCRRYFRATIGQPPEIRPGDEATAPIVPDELFDCIHAVANYGRKDLLSDRKDASADFTGKAIVKDADFIRS